MKIIVDRIPIQCYVRQNLTLLLLNELLLRRSYGLVLAAKSAFIISDAILFVVLNKYVILNAFVQRIYFIVKTSVKTQGQYPN